MTDSETLFETLCRERSVPCTRIPTAAYTTPDYEIVLGVHRVLVEVKQLDPNVDDKRVNKALEDGTQIDGVVSPAPRLRQQIASAYRQLKAGAREGQPCLVVIYNNSGFLNFIDSFTVTTAMFGRYGVRLGLGKSGAIRETGRGFMGKASVTRNTCKSLSAVCVLKDARSGSLRLELHAVKGRATAARRYISTPYVRLGGPDGQRGVVEVTTVDQADIRALGSRKTVVRHGAASL